MHYLHKVLVYIPDAVPDRDGYEQDELIEAIRNHAENETESAYGQAYDWRETNCAGRWEGEYPTNVLFASDNTEKFLSELRGVKAEQENELRTCLAQLEQTVGTDLKRIAEGLMARKSYDEHQNGFNFMTSYYLHCVADYLHGDYRCDSYFYNTHDYTASLCPCDLDAVEKTPADWALVMFDYHN